MVNRIFAYGLILFVSFALGQAARAGFDAAATYHQMRGAIQPMLPQIDPNAIAAAIGAAIWAQLKETLTPAFVASGLASLLAAMLPQARPDTPYAFLRQVIDLLAINMANAANARRVNGVYVPPEV